MSRRENGDEGEGVRLGCCSRFLEVVLHLNGLSASSQVVDGRGFPDYFIDFVHVGLRAACVEQCYSSFLLHPPLHIKLLIELEITFKVPIFSFNPILQDIPPPSHVSPSPVTTNPPLNTYGCLCLP